MLTYICREAFSKEQENLFACYTTFSRTNPTLGRVLALPVAIVDVTYETIKSPAAALENLITTIVNIAGHLFYLLSGNYSQKKFIMRDGLRTLQASLISCAATPIGCIMAPLKLFFQAINLLYEPVNSSTISYDSYGSYEKVQGFPVYVLKG